MQLAYQGTCRLHTSGIYNFRCHVPCFVGYFACSKLGNLGGFYPHIAQPGGLLPLDHPRLPNQVEESRGGPPVAPVDQADQADQAGQGQSDQWLPKAARWFATRMEKSGLKANAGKLRMIGYHDIIGFWGGAREFETKIQNDSQ